MRLARAVASCASLPRTTSSGSSAVVTEIEACSAASRVRSRASATMSATSISVAPGIGSAPCTRDSSISSPTSFASRPPSCWMRAAKRCTASGSSAASWIASASRVSPPTGVFSSWETLATKSRRTLSSRRCSLSSASSRQTPRTRSLRRPAQRHGGDREGDRFPAQPPDRQVDRRARTARRSPAPSGRPPTRPGKASASASSTPIVRAAGFTNTARSSRSTTTTPLSRLWTISAASASSDRSSPGVDASSSPDK